MKNGVGTAILQTIKIWQLEGIVKIHTNIPSP